MTETKALAIKLIHGKLVKKAFRIEDFCFPEQIKFIRDTAAFKTAVCSRRSGKTVACAADLIHTSLLYAGIVCLYITLNRRSAKRIIWKDLLKINKEFSLNAKINLTDLSLTFPNGSEIHVSGAKDSSEIEKFRGLAIKKCYIDECFHPDTLVDTLNGPVPIKDIRPGAYVRNASGFGQVLEVSRKKLDRCIEINYRNKIIKCSLNHPFFTSRGWINASQLKKGDYLVNTDLCVQLLRQSKQQKALQKAANPSILQHKMRKAFNLVKSFFSGKDEKNKTVDQASKIQVQDMQAADGEIEIQESKQASFLLNCLLKEISRGKREAEYPHENKQPDGECFYSEEDGCYFKKNQSHASNQGRERASSNEARGCLDENIPTIETQLSNQDGSKKDQPSWTADLLQGRSSTSRAENSNRGRWKLSSQQEAFRRKERFGSFFTRVESVKILERGSDERNPESHFFDLSVDGHPSYSVNGVLVHNCQSFKQYIKELIDEVIAPSLFDYAGSLVLIGTPGPVPVGYFFECSQSAEWSHHHWNMFRNPWLEIKSNQSVRSLVDRELKRKGITENHPIVRREYYGEWVTDYDSLVFRYRAEINDFDTLPPSSKRWTYVVGVDLGYDDSDAIAVIAFNEVLEEAFLVEEIIKNKQGLTELASQLEYIENKYKPMKYVVDTGGLGKKIVEELNRRFGTRLVAAEKTRKLEFIEILNDAMRTGRFKAKKESTFAQDTMLIEWDRDTVHLESKKISTSFHSDSCFTEGTLVFTENGNKPIERIEAGERVLTREGFKEVLFSGKTGEKEVIELEFSNGSILRCTSDHPIFTSNRGFIRADALCYGDRLFTREEWENQNTQYLITEKAKPKKASKLHLMRCLLLDIQNQGEPTLETISAASLGMVKMEDVLPHFTGKFGSTIMEKSRRVFTSITRMATRSTTILQIFSVFLQRIIGTNTGKRPAPEAKKIFTTYIKRLKHLKYGIRPLKELSGINNTLSIGKKNLGRRFQQNVQYVGNLICEIHWFLHWCFIAQTNAGPALGENQGLMISISNASNVNKHLEQTSSQKGNSVATLVRRQPLTGNVSVYNLKVKDKPEYFANGILVHNCDAVLYAFRECLQWLSAPEDKPPQRGSLEFLQREEEQMEENALAELEAETQENVMEDYWG